MRAWWYEPFLFACGLVTIIGGYHMLGGLMVGGVVYSRAPAMAWQGAKNIAFMCRVAAYRVRHWRR